jgi:hypothetical protein
MTFSTDSQRRVAFVVAVCGRCTKYTFGSSMTQGVLHVRPVSWVQTLKKNVFTHSVR